MSLWIFVSFEQLSAGYFSNCKKSVVASVTSLIQKGGLFLVMALIHPLIEGACMRRLLTPSQINYKYCWWMVRRA